MIIYTNCDDFEVKFKVIFSYKIVLLIFYVIYLKNAL